MLKKAIAKLVERKELSREEMAEAMREVMSGEGDPAAIASFLTALRMKGETVDEIVACADVMREKAVHLPTEGDVLEIVGTGGDEAFTFNLSTTCLPVIAAAGIPAAKHGNRGVSSKSGAADVLEALGVKIDNAPEVTAQMLRDIGLCFLFAQKYHSAMRFVGPVRKAVGIRTVFNILGPLTNPAFANIELIGVYDKALVRPMAEVLLKQGVKRAMVVYGNDRLDEISVSDTTTVSEIKDGAIRDYTLDPREYGIAFCRKEDMLGGGPAENAQITLAILNGEERGPKRDAVLLNAGAAIYLGGKAATIQEGIVLAASLIDSGAAKRKLEEMIEYSRKDRIAS